MSFYKSDKRQGLWKPVKFKIPEINSPDRKPNSGRVKPPNIDRKQGIKRARPGNSPSDVNQQKRRRNKRQKKDPQKKKPHPLGVRPATHPKKSQHINSAQSQSDQSEESNSEDSQDPNFSQASDFEISDSETDSYDNQNNKKKRNKINFPKAQSKLRERQNILRKKLKIAEPDPFEENRTRYAHIRSQIKALKKANSSSIFRQLKSITTDNQEETDLISHALNTTSKKTQRQALEYVLNNRLKSELETQKRLQNLQNRATDLNDPSHAGNNDTHFLKPTESVLHAQNRTRGRILLLGQDNIRRKKHPEPPKDFLAYKHRETLANADFESEAQLQEAYEHREIIDRMGNAKTMKKPLSNPANLGKANEILHESYAQRLRLNHSDKEETLFKSAYELDTQNLVLALKKLKDFKTPGAPIQPLVKSLAIYLPHFYSGWKMLTMNNIQFQNSLKKDSKTLQRHQKKCQTDEEISAYMLTLMKNIVRSLRPSEMSFEKAWKHLQVAKELENNFPWLGTTEETLLNEEKIKMGLIPTPKSETKPMARNRVTQHMQQNLSSESSTALALHDSFFSSTGTTRVTTQRSHER